MFYDDSLKQLLNSVLPQPNSNITVTIEMQFYQIKLLENMRCTKYSHVIFDSANRRLSMTAPDFKMITMKCKHFDSKNIQHFIGH